MNDSRVRGLKTGAGEATKWNEGEAEGEKYRGIEADKQKEREE